VDRNANGACGSTGHAPRDPIYLSYENCRGIYTVRDAATHLIGESAHHIGVAA
jgi:hypothetical protein